VYTRRIHRDTVEMQMPFSEEEENNTQSEPFMDHKRVSKCICLYLPQKWNTEAEANAQKWANTCSMTHSPLGITPRCSRIHQFPFIQVPFKPIGCPMAYCPISTSKYFINYQLSLPYKSGPSCADCPSACENKLCCKSRTQECPIKNELQQIAQQWDSTVTTMWHFGVPASCRCTNQILQTANHSLTQIQ
uniref:Uncharacterized protein n=1 Tax=Oryzias latipes TaxID=8090 RepID=A0A3B3H2G7_ORYLA